MKRWVVFPVLMGFTLLGGVCDPGSVDVFPEIEERFSFENGLDGWAAAASDLGEPPSLWQVSVTGDESFVGVRSASLFLSNDAGQGRVFLRRRFDAIADTDYRVEVSLQLGTSDVGAMNLWSLIGGAFRESPTHGADLLTIGDTGGSGADGVTDGAVDWVARTADFDIRTGPEDGRIWLALGVWGTSPFARDYYVDDVVVIVRRR